MRYQIYYLVLLILVIGCSQNPKTDREKKVTRDTTITIDNSFSPKFLDSTKLETFLTNQHTNDSVANRLREFYAKRNYQYAWFTDSGFVEYGSGFAAMLDNYLAYSKDSSIYNNELHVLIDSFSLDPRSIQSQPQLLKTELLLSTQFFRYAYRVYEGGNLNQDDLGWFIPKRKLTHWLC